MKSIRFIAITFFLAQPAIAQVHFPMDIGDTWYYSDFTYICEGTHVLCQVLRDTSLNGVTYKYFGNVFAGPFVRADSVRVYEYSVSDSAEYVVFDFSAEAGDTVCVRDNGATVTIALGNLRFQRGEDIFTIVDSIGVVSVAHQVCFLQLSSATIAGKQAFPRTDVLYSDPDVPSRLFLAQNYPNPFNSSTNIEIHASETQVVSLAIYNSLGQCLEELYRGGLEAGLHTFTWQADRWSSGLYFCILRTQSGQLSRSLLLLK